MFKQRPCRYFARGQKCYKGSECKFSHDTNIKTQGSKPAKPKPKPTDIESDFREWKGNISQRAINAHPSRTRLDFVFGEARRLIDKGDGVLQDVVRELAREGGLKRIQELIEYNYVTTDDTQSHRHIFDTQMVPFLEIITSASVLQSLVLENAVGTIYNVLYGVCGRRGYLLLTYIADVLSGQNKTNEPLYHLELTLVMFWHIIKWNSFAFANDLFRPLATQFQEIFENLRSQNKDSAPLLETARVHLQRILRHLAVGSSLPTVNGNETQMCVDKHHPKSAFVVKPKPPGGRHDNDFKDICDVKIMPTFGEILSSQSEYLPVKDPQRWHVGGINGLLDRNFRLLREDTVGQLRDAIYSLKSSPRNITDQNKRQQLRTLVYHHTRVTYIILDRKAGLQFDVVINQPIDMKKMNKKEREDWWQRTKRLQPGALVCLVGTEGAVFCTVSRLPDRNNRSKALKHEPSLWDSEYIATVRLELAQFSETNVELILSQYKTKTPTISLVEFPGVLLASFEPTLRALQTIKKNDDLPFPELLSPLDLEDQTGKITTPLPPAYSLRKGFEFDLSCLLKDPSEKLTMRAGDQVNIQQLQERSTLDNAQAVAVVNTLQRSIGLIQGPPGTGKSYTGVALTNVLTQALIENRKRASVNKRTGEDLGPIICVCYTNHALDQFLEDLLDKKITTQIVRIGARSNSEKLEQYNLRHISTETYRTKAERKEEWQLHKELDLIGEDFKHSLKKVDSKNRTKDFLRRHNQRHFAQFYKTDDEDFQRQKARGGPIHRWLQHGEVTTENEPRSVPILQNVHIDLMSQKERKRLHSHWETKMRQETNAKIIELTERQKTIKSQLDNVHAECKIRCLRDAHVIGVTTTGLAKSLDMFRRLRSKIVLCEEAGEVLESHLLTALLPSIEHLILIGDHQQLRPQVQNYELSRENWRGGEQYSLDVSLFERLVNPDEEMNVRLPFSSLETQRRMHPSIAQLVRETLYPRLEDAQSVLEYPEVDGMRRRLFWLDHRHHQGDASKADALETSHWNNHEADMTVALVNHLIRQGTYKNNEIAVLTPYLGQLHILRKKLESSFAITLGERDEEGLEKAGLGEADAEETQQIQKSNLLNTLRIATIDNFQGEEAKVVVISLVRSNDQNQCGFLRTSNRINVLLSRAKHGMYIIGNSETSIHVEMWEHVIGILKRNGNFGPSLELQCPRHPDRPILVSEADDFVKYAPEGGCNERCVNRLKCGHACHQKCHSDILHNAVYCQEPCPRKFKACDHICPKVCGDLCPERCMIKVHQAGRTLECGHLAETLPCWQSQDPSTAICWQRVEKQVRGCNHKVTVPCHVDVRALKYTCRMICQRSLSCGHTCRRQCSECVVHSEEGVTVNHEQCIQVCGRNQSTCNHACQKPCHGTEPCPACEMRCEVQCAHSKCPKLCAEPCAPCAEASCESSCPHSQCSMPCAAPCDHIPCSRRCERLLQCGHQCPSVCGEVCPPSSFCQHCASPEVKEHVVDFILAEMYAETNLDENPCIFPRCGHFLTIESMDGQMDMKKYYIVEDDKPVDIRSSAEPFSVDDIKRCATCRGSLRDLSRYGRLVRRAILDESTKRFLLYLNREYLPLAEMLPKQLTALGEKKDRLSPQLFDYQETITIQGPRNTQNEQMRSIVKKYGGSRWKEVNYLRGRIWGYQKAVDETEQPFVRVQTLVESARRRKGRGGAFEFDGSVVQTKGMFLATGLLMRLDISLLGDFLSLYQEACTGGKRCELKVDLSATLDECIHFINRAREATRVAHEVEGYIFLARLHALERSHGTRDNLDPDASLNQAKEAIASARRLCLQHSGQTRGLEVEIDDAEKMLRNGTFFSAVSSEERTSVVAAMARDMRGTGHWYYCVNGHPFTIGECGGAMQVATCPECGATVGGRNHQTAAGVTRADDLEQQLRELRLQ